MVSGDLLVIGKRNKMLFFSYFLYYLFRLWATMGGKIGQDSYQHYARISYKLSGEQWEMRALLPSTTPPQPLGILVRWADSQSTSFSSSHPGPVHLSGHSNDSLLLSYYPWKSSPKILSLKYLQCYNCFALQGTITGERFWEQLVHKRDISP